MGEVTNTLVVNGKVEVAQKGSQFHDILIKEVLEDVEEMMRNKNLDVHFLQVYDDKSDAHLIQIYAR